MIHSLRLRLVLFIGAAIALAALIQFIASFHAAMTEANKLFDYHMERMAGALQDGRFDQVSESTYKLGESISFDFVIQLWGTQGSQVFQSRPYKILPDQGKAGYATVTLDNGDWRIYTTRTNKHVIQVAQKLDARRERAISLAWHALWPLVPVSLILIAVTWLLVTSALSPLNRIGAELAARSADSLQPVSNSGVPSEVSLLVAELNSLLSRVRRTLQAHQQFIADAAHELRSPITALRLQMETAMQAKNDEKRWLAVSRLSGGIYRVSRLVEQLLALARQDPLAQQGSPVRTSLLSCVDQAVADTVLLAVEKNIALKYGTTSEAEVLGNESDLTIMVRNLIDNAVRYTPRDGQVRIDIGVAEGQAVLTVQDSGPGIPTYDQARVYDRFYRVAGTGVEGSGLGLAIVKAIVDRYGGRIRLARANLGGLQVTVDFPLLSS